MISRRNLCTQGVVAAVFTWLVYAAAEFFFQFTAPIIVQPGQTAMIGWHHLVLGFSLLVFALAGVIAGLAAGLGIWLLPSRMAARIPARVVSSISLPVAFAANIVIRRPLSQADHAGLVFSALLALCLIWTSLSPRDKHPARFLTGPWTVCVLLTGVTWVVSTREAGVVFPALMLVCVIGLALLADGSLRSAWRSSDARLASWRPVLSLVLILILVPAGTWLLFRANGGSLLESGPAQSASNVPDVVLVTLDTVRGDHTSIGGYERDTTPFLTSLAGESTVYNRAVAPTNWTLPSHASIFTGLPYRSHGASRRLDEGFTTLAESVGDAGYYTAAVVANFSWLHRSSGIAQGFQTFRTLELLSPKYYLVRAVRNLIDLAIMTDLSRRFHRAEEVNGYAFRMLDEVAGEDGHFFLFLNYMDAHTPYLPPPPYKDLYPGRNLFLTAAGYREMKDEVMAGRRDITTTERESYVSQYDGGIAYMDSQLEALVARLREMGRYDNTLIIVTSDHGEAFGDDGYVEHSGSVKQDQVGVPLLIKYPRQDRGETVTDAVSLMDIMPTVIASLGLEAPPAVHGSVLPRAGEQQARRVVAEHHLQRRHCRLNELRCVSVTALFERHWKYLIDSKGNEDLYDLAADPTEANDLSSADDGFHRELRLALATWMESVGEYEGEAVEMDAETIDRLRSLGYIQ